MRSLTTLLVACLLSMCNSGKQISQSTNMQAPLIIYKTTEDYSDNIPVILDKTGERIISYPAISDIKLNGMFAKPDNLTNGFLLDNFGLSPRSAFTSFTFEEYSKLDKVPTIQEFMDRIIDKDPFSEMYTCGKRADFNTTEELNKLIKKNLESCKKLK